MRSILIDPEGILWHPESSELYKRLGYPDPDFDLTGFAIRNLGCVHVRHFAEGMRLRAQPGAVRRPTFDSVVKQMIAADCRRFVFEIGPWAPHLEIIGNLNDAVARLEDLLDGGANHRTEPIVCEPLSLGRLRHPKRAPLCRLIKQWKRTRGQLGRTPLLPFEEAGVAQRTVLTRSFGEGRALIEFFGPRLDVFDANWSTEVIGLDLENQPDPVYGEGAARGYHEVRVAEQPRLELVDAVINAPGRPPQRSRYERLVLPWRAADGTLFVSGASLLRTRVSLGSAR